MYRRSSHSQTHPEEKVPWASFADALTGLLFVFILLALSFAHQLQEAKKKADAEFAEANRKVEQGHRAQRITRDLVSTDLTASQREHSVALCLEHAFADMPGFQLRPSPTMEEARLSLYLDVPGEVLPTIRWFAPGDSALEAGPCLVARAIGPCLEQAILHPGLLDTNDDFTLRVFVEGHTDISPVLGGPRAIPTNWELSGARAAAVVRAFLVPPAEVGMQASCPANRDVSVLQRQIAEGKLDVVAAGLAARRPAWKRLCEVEAEDSVCICLEQAGGRPAECTDVLRADVIAHGGDPETLPSEQLIAWANRKDEQDEDARRRLQRRVDLRFEVTQRDMIARGAQ